MMLEDKTPVVTLNFFIAMIDSEMDSFEEG